MARPDARGSSQLPSGVIFAIKRHSYGNIREFWRRHGPGEHGGAGELSCSMITFYRAMSARTVSYQVVREIHDLAVKLDLVSRDGDKSDLEVSRELLGYMLALIDELKANFNAHSLEDLFWLVNKYRHILAAGSYVITADDLKRIIPRRRGVRG
jgi:hypothetical protein